MKYRAFKKCKDYKDIFTREKETKELQIELDGVNIYVIEHQFGTPLKEPCVIIDVKDGVSYGMDLSEFIKRIAK